MKICGDMLKFISPFLSDKARVYILYLNKQVRRLCQDKYYKFIFNSYIDYDIAVPLHLKHYITKIKKISCVYKNLEKLENVTHLVLSDNPLNIPPNLIFLRICHNFPSRIHSQIKSKIIAVSSDYKFMIYLKSRTRIIIFNENNNIIDDKMMGRYI